MKKSIKKISILIFFSIVYFPFLFSQNILQFKHYEDTLKDLGKEILISKNDDEKIKANGSFIKKLEEILNIENSFNYPFDSLTSIARLVSPDNKFRLFNWHLQKQDGTYEYFGFIQMNPKKCQDSLLFRLIDKSDKLFNPDTASLNCGNWYGAHYYKMIYEKIHLLCNGPDGIEIDCTQRGRFIHLIYLIYLLYLLIHIIHLI